LANYSLCSLHPPSSSSQPAGTTSLIYEKSGPPLSGLLNPLLNDHLTLPALSARASEALSNELLHHLIGSQVNLYDLSISHILLYGILF